MLSTASIVTWQALGLGPVAHELLLPLKVLQLILISNLGSDKSFADDLTESRYCKCESSLCVTIHWGSSWVFLICSHLQKNYPLKPPGRLKRCRCQVAGFSERERRTSSKALPIRIPPTRNIYRNTLPRLTCQPKHPALQNFILHLPLQTKPINPKALILDLLSANRSFETKITLEGSL